VERGEEEGNVINQQTLMLISIIAAIDEQNAIGQESRLLCHLPNDLKYFKSVTQGHTVIMGRKTFQSLPNGALPHRRNIVISRNPALQLAGCEVYPSLEAAFHACRNEDEVFVIGGGSIYEAALPLANKLYITVIHHTFAAADTFFPAIEASEWKEVSNIKYPADEKNKYEHAFVVWEREKVRD
jgi:dihydrofolate reductase